MMRRDGITGIPEEFHNEEVGRGEPNTSANADGEDKMLRMIRAWEQKREGEVLTPTELEAIAQLVTLPGSWQAELYPLKLAGRRKEYYKKGGAHLPPVVVKLKPKISAKKPTKEVVESLFSNWEQMRFLNLNSRACVVEVDLSSCNLPVDAAEQLGSALLKLPHVQKVDFQNNRCLFTRTGCANLSAGLGDKGHARIMEIDLHDVITGYVAAELGLLLQKFPSLEKVNLKGNELFHVDTVKKLCDSFGPHHRWLKEFLWWHCDCSMPKAMQGLENEPRREDMYRHLYSKHGRRRPYV